MPASPRIADRLNDLRGRDFELKPTPSRDGLQNMGQGDDGLATLDAIRREYAAE